MRLIHSLPLLVLACLVTTLLNAHPIDQQSTIVLCAPEDSPPESVADMGIARFNSRINPIKAARMAETAIRDFPTLANAVCTGELAKIRKRTHVDDSGNPDADDQRTFQHLSEAFNKAESEATQLRSREGTEFSYRVISAEDTQKAFKRSDSEHSIILEQLSKEQPSVANSGIGRFISNYSGITLFLPATGLIILGYPEFATYYLIALGLGASLYNVGIWNAASIFFINTAGITAYAGYLYKTNNGDEFDDSWEMKGYDPKAVKTAYQTLIDSHADTATVATSTMAVLTARLSALLSFTAIKASLVNYFGLTVTQGLGLTLGQAMLNFAIEFATGYPPEDWIPLFTYDESADVMDTGNWPYWGKRIVISNILVLGWVSGWIVCDAAWATAQMVKGLSFAMKRQKKS